MAKQTASCDFIEASSARSTLHALTAGAVSAEVADNALAIGRGLDVLRGMARATKALRMPAISASTRAKERGMVMVHPPAPV
jgi:hypothetical protein